MRTIMILCAVGWLARSAMGDAAASSPGRYYVSPGGDDRHDGRSETTAWRTAAKVNSAEFEPGDCILFQRGGDWHEQLIASSDGTETHPITYADYGDANAAKPTFWGSDVIPAGAFTPAGDSVYSFPVSALPTGHAYWVFADHQFLNLAADYSRMPADSFFIAGPTVFIRTAGVDPRSDAVAYTASDRAQGANADSSLICSNGHNNLIFNNLVGKETAAAVNSGGVPDAYVFRIQGSANVRLDHCEAHAGGKHHIGVINSTGFIGTHLYARGCIPGLAYGNAGAFVSFSDASRHGDTSQWIDCKVDHFDPQQQSFITHGPGLGNLLIRNLTSLGCSIGIGTDAPGEIVTIKGGLLTGPTCDVYGAHVLIDGLRISGDAKIDLFGNDNVVQNCVDRQSINAQGGIVVRGRDNVIRFNTLDHRSAAGPCVELKSSAGNTRFIGNLFTGPTLPINDNGAAGLVLDYNGFDDTAGPPRSLNRDAHLVVGNPQFADGAVGNYVLTPHSPDVGKVPAARIDGLTHDCLDHPRPVYGAYDIGAFQTQFVTATP
ncbi:MAG: hypothetical protein ABSD28_03160 [Tepidisphaeraceae bacterium]